jgi:hypothetical protein
MKRLRYTDAFVDESIRGQRYIIACALLEARDLADVRQQMRQMVVGGRRLHFYQERDRTRRCVLEALATMPVRVEVVVCVRGQGVSNFAARDACLAELIRRLQELSVPRVVIETRHDDRDDATTIIRSRAAEPALVFDHVEGDAEPLLWIADAVAWSYGAGTRWRELADPVVAQVTTIRP